MLVAEIRLTSPLGRALRAGRLSPVIDALDRALARNRAGFGR